MGHCLEISSLYRNANTIDVADALVVVVIVVVVISTECKIDRASRYVSVEIICRIIRSDPQKLELISAMIFSR